MPSGLAALLDDIATIAKVAAASVDDTTAPTSMVIRAITHAKTGR